MGCHVSSDGNFETLPNYEDTWRQIKQQQQHNTNFKNNKKRKGWKIVRILLVSTYKDFKNERNAVLSVIENQLQPLASEKLIFLQVEDLVYGSKNYFEEIANIYLIEKCCSAASRNDIVFYCHFLGECAGFVVDSTFTDESYLQQKSLKYGQTFSEVFLQLAGVMNDNFLQNTVQSNQSSGSFSADQIETYKELTFKAFQKKSPGMIGPVVIEALFLHRNPGFLQELPFNVTNFIDAPKGRDRAQHLAQSIKKHVKSSNFIEYSVKTSGINNLHFKQILFDDLSPATNPLKSAIDKYIESLPYAEDIKILNSSQKIREFYQTSSSKPFLNIIQQINSNIKNHQNTIIYGDYSTGKTTVLYKLSKEHPKAVFITAKEEMNIQQELEKSIGVDIDEPKIRHLVLIDDIHLLSTDLSTYAHLTIIGTSRKKKCLSDAQLIEIPSHEPGNIQDVLTTYTSSELKSSNILKKIKERRRKSLGSIEEGSNEPNWNDLKLRIIGTLAKFGSTEQKCAQLFYFKILSVVEADICLMESDSRGHLLISVLCFLTLQENGINEIDLRQLLADEHILLPIGIRRNYRNLPFDYCSDDFGSRPQILPLRWYYIINRIGHLFIPIDTDDNHFIIPSAVQRIIKKKFLSKPANLEHFQKLLKSFYSTKL